MTRCSLHESGAAEAYFYGEGSAGERAAIATHLQHCAECRRVVEELGVIRAALASRPDVSAPPGGDWSAFMARLEHAVELDAARAVVAPPAAARPVPQRASLVAYLAMAAVLALVTISAVLVTRQRGIEVSTDPQTTVTPPPAAAPVADSTGPDPALALVSEQHFERSKLVLLGLTTKDPVASGAADWEYERQLAAKLLDDTRLYRLAAEERGMNAIAGVMRDLELVLLQASMSQAPDRGALQQVQRTIRRRDLLTKMEVVSAGLVP